MIRKQNNRIDLERPQLFRFPNHISQNSYGLVAPEYRNITFGFYRKEKRSAGNVCTAIIGHAPMVTRGRRSAQRTLRSVITVGSAVRTTNHLRPAHVSFPIQNTLGRNANSPERTHGAPPRLFCKPLVLLLLTTCVQPLIANEPAPDESRVRIVKDVDYLGNDRAEKLDLYLPAKNGKGRRPAVVIVHGGGWQAGDKAAKREQNIGNTLAAAGYVCASVNYRLSNKSDHLATRLRQAWPGNLQDCKTAVRFLRKHADKYAIDAKHIGAIGGSAGGHLVAMMAVTDTDDDLDPTGPYSDQSCRIQAVVPMYGVHDVSTQARRKETSISDADERLYRNASPITWITPDDPPALILHGTKDALVPVEQSQILHDRLNTAKVPSRLIIIEGAPHSFHLQPKQQDLRETVIVFFDRHLKQGQ